MSNVILCLGLLLTSLLVYKNHCREQEIRRNELLHLAEWMYRQDPVSKHDIRSLLLMDTSGDTLLLSSLSEGARRLGIYVNRMHCSDCWMKIARDVARMCREEDAAQPFIIIDGYSLMDQKILEREDTLSVRYYQLLGHDEEWLARLSSAGWPFVFTLNPDKTLSSVIFYEDVIEPVFQEFARLVFPDGSPADTLQILKANVRLGRVSYKRLFPMKYILANYSAKDCRILKVEPSCNCVFLEETPQVIAAGETAVLQFNFLSDARGYFYREVRVFTDQRSEPYVLSLEGECE